jgi:hypothetical protein
MTVPAYPEKLDGICYYIWTDIFFGDVGKRGHGRGVVILACHLLSFDAIVLSLV